MLKTQFYVFTFKKKTKDKIRPEKAKKQKLKVARNPKKKKRPAQLVANLCLHGHEQRLIVVRLRAIVLYVLTKISPQGKLENLKKAVP